MKRLDWKQLLGFSQITSERDRKALSDSRFSGKIGRKTCQAPPAPPTPSPPPPVDV